MKKALMFLLGLVLVAPAFASVRTDGMGILPLQDNDIDVIWTFPQMIEDYAVVDYRLEFLGGTADNWGGTLHKDKCIGNWGIYINRPFMNTTFTSIDYIDAQVGAGILTGVGNWNNLVNYMDSRIETDYDIYTPTNKVDLFKSFKAGNGVLGLKINYADEQDGDDDDTENWFENDANGYDAGDTITWEDTFKARVIGIDLGYGLKDLGPFKNFDAAVGYSMGSYSHTDLYIYQNLADSGPTEQSYRELAGDGINEMRLSVRGVKEMTDVTKLVVNANMKMGKLAFEDNYRVDGDYDGVLGEVAGEYDLSTFEHKSNVMGLGINCVHNVHDGLGKVVAGLNFISAKGTWTSTSYTSLAASTSADQIVDTEDHFNEYTEGYKGIWANIGVEASLLKWLVFRGGMSRDLIGSRSYEEILPSTVVTNAYRDRDENTEHWNENNPTQMTFGVGVVYKNWNVDLLIATSGIEEFLSDTNFGEGLLYTGSVVNNVVKGQLVYNL